MERYQEVMVALSESVMLNSVKRPLVDKSRLRHIRLAIKPRYLGNHVYMKNLLTAVADVPSWSALRDAMKGNFVIPRTRLKLGERAFSVAAPQAWNRLPTDLKTLRYTPAFKRSLKTFFFWAAYNV